VTIGGEYGPFPRRTMNADIRRTVQHTEHYVWTKETAEYLKIEPAVVERCQFDVRIHGVRQLATTATSTLAHVQFAVASTTETTKTLGRTFSDMSCARTPSWNRRHSRGDHPRRRRHLDRIRFGAAFLTVVFELPWWSVSLMTVVRSLCVHACSDIFVSFRHRTLSESKPVTFTSLRLCRHAYNANNIFTVCQFS